ncbi:hypothetical protein Bca4012_028729 [Brassica carinata]
MALRFPQLLKVAEEQQNSKYSSGGKMIPTPEEAATFQPQVVAEGGWEKCWEDGVTPWDQGRATPLILHLLDSSSLPLGRTLVPGCGGGHDVVAMANPERFVVGLDISEKALKKANETYGSAPNAKYFAFMKEDFFTWRPDELFDLIFDYVLPIMLVELPTKYLSLRTVLLLDNITEWKLGRFKHVLLSSDDKAPNVVFLVHVDSTNDEFTR